MLTSAHVVGPFFEVWAQVSATIWGHPVHLAATLLGSRPMSVDWEDLERSVLRAPSGSGGNLRRQPTHNPSTSVPKASPGRLGAVFASMTSSSSAAKKAAGSSGQSLKDDVKKELADAEKDPKKKGAAMKKPAGKKDESAETEKKAKGKGQAKGKSNTKGSAKAKAKAKAKGKCKVMKKPSAADKQDKTDDADEDRDDEDHDDGEAEGEEHAGHDEVEQEDSAAAESKEEKCGVKTMDTMEEENGPKKKQKTTCKKVETKEDAVMEDAKTKEVEVSGDGGGGDPEETMDDNHEEGEEEDVKETDPVVYPADIQLQGRVGQQRTQFCQAASAFYRSNGYDAATAYRLASKDWMMCPQRAALISNMTESEQIRRRFKTKSEDVN